MPRKLKESQDWSEEEVSNKKAKTKNENQSANLDIEVVRAIQHFNDPSGSTFKTIVSHLESQNINDDDADIRQALKNAVTNGKLTQPNRARWKVTETTPKAKPVEPKSRPTNEPENRSFVGLSRDTACEIMSYLTMAEIFRLRRICKGWLELVESRKLWKDIDLVSTGTDIPISVAHYLLQLAQGQLELFSMNEEHVYLNKGDYSIVDVMESVLKESSTLKHLNIYNLYKVPFLDSALQCTKLETLSIYGSASDEIYLSTLNKINSALPLLKELNVCIHSTRSYRKKHPLTDYETVTWGTNLESVSIETDGNPFQFNAPLNLKSFSLTTEKAERYRNPKVTLTNIKEIFSSRLESLELLETTVGDEALKALQENCADIDILGLSLSGRYGRYQTQVSQELVLPEVKKLTLRGGGYELKLDTPNVEVLELLALDQLYYQFKSLEKLEQIIFTQPGRNHDDMLKALLKQAKNVKEVTISEAWQEYNFPDLFPWHQIESLTSISNVYDYKSLKYLTLASLELVEATVCLPNLLELTIQSDKLEKLSLNVPSLSYLNVSGCNKVTIAPIENFSVMLKTFETGAHLALDCLSFLKPKELYMISREMQSPDFDLIVACETIEKLAFYKCEMTDRGVIRFATGMGKRLKGLLLANEGDPNDKTAFTDKCLYTVAKECPNLEEIELESCPILSGKALHDLLLTSKYIKTVRVTQCPKIAKATVIKGFVDPQFAFYFI